MGPALAGGPGGVEGDTDYGAKQAEARRWLASGRGRGFGPGSDPGRLGRFGLLVSGFGWAGFSLWAGLGLLPFLSLILFLFPISFQTQLNYLNSKTTLNSSTYALKPIKQMHHHVCTNKLALKINFNYLCNKIRLNAI